jgi:hypothetical protein
MDAQLSEHDQVLLTLGGWPAGENTDLVASCLHGRKEDLEEGGEGEEHPVHVTGEAGLSCW